MHMGLVNRMRQIRMALRIALASSKELESLTKDSRSELRNAKIALAAVASAAEKAIQVACTLVTVPAAIGYLGPESYGLWMTINAFLVVSAFADFGLGNGLLSSIAWARGRDDTAAARATVSNAVAMLSVVGVVGLGVTAGGFGIAPWKSLLSVTDAHVMEARAAATVLLVMLFLGVPLAVAPRVNAAYQQSYLSSIWNGLGSVLGLAGVLAAIHMNLSLPWLVGATLAGPLCAAVANSVMLFGFGMPELRPRLMDVQWSHSWDLLRSGLGYLALQVFAILSFGLDGAIVARMLGHEAVAELSVGARLIGMIPVVLGFALTPLWPAYGEAIARGDSVWVRRTLSKSFKVVAPSPDGRGHVRPWSNIPVARRQTKPFKGGPACNSSPGNGCMCCDANERPAKWRARDKSATARRVRRCTSGHPAEDGHGGSMGTCRSSTWNFCSAVAALGSAREPADPEVS